MKWLPWLAGLVVVLWLAVGWLAIRVYLPVNPVKPYFLTSVNRISGLDWPLARFQPVFLWRYQKDGGVFLKVIYRNGKRMSKLADVFVGGRWREEDYPAIKVDNGMEARFYKFDLGARIKILYLAETTVTPETEPIKAEICGRSPAFCQITAYIEEIGGLESVFNNKQMPKGKIIPAMEVSKTLDER